MRAPPRCVGNSVRFRNRAIAAVQQAPNLLKVAAVQNAYSPATTLQYSITADCLHLRP